MEKSRTKRELEASELEAKAKAIRRQEKAFWDEVTQRLDEVKDRFGMSDKYDDICLTYGAYTEAEREALYRHLTSARQVEYYARIAPKPEGNAASSF